MIPVDVMINGKGPYHFMLDTGSPYTVLMTDIAAELGIKAADLPEESADSKERTMVKTGQLDSLRFGGARVEDLNCLILPAQSGAPFRGVLGAAVFQQYVVTIDYAAHTLTLSDPIKFTYQGKGVLVPLTIAEDDDHAVMSAKVDGIAARFALDTGLDGAIKLFGGFVKQHDLLKKSPPKQTKIVDSGPLGDETMTAMLSTLTMGKNVFHDVHTLLQAPDAATSLPADGTIGGEILRRFTVTFDYTNKRAWLEPNKDYASPYPFNRSGIVADYKDSVYVAMSIDAHSPAAKAKLKAGDRILKINGVDTAQIDLLRFRGFVCQPVGTVLHLMVQSGKKTREVALILKEDF